MVGNFVGSAALGGVTSVMPCINTLVGFFLLGLCFANVEKKIRKKFPET